MDELWDEQTLKDYFYVMQSAFYDSAVAEEVESDKRFSEENPEEAEEL
jgi:hypothetical protein